jgi:hypothetical protein
MERNTMKSISRWLAVAGASAGLATCLVAQTAAALPPAGPALALPKDLPGDVHMPASGYSIQTIFEDVSVGLHSPAGVANQFAQYAAAVRSAGWQEKAQRRGDKSSELDVVNGISEVDISLDRDNGTDIRLHVHCQRQIGDRETCDGVASDLPPSPPDAQISTPQHLGVTLEVKTNSSKDTLYAEYESAMAAAGWQETKVSRGPVESEQIFNKNGMKVRVHLIQAPGQGAARLDLEFGAG